MTIREALDLIPHVRRTYGTENFTRDSYTASLWFEIGEKALAEKHQLFRRKERGMSDLIIKGAKGIKDGLYVIKDGELFKYKSKGGTVRTYPITDRPRGEWIEYNKVLADTGGFCDEYEQAWKCSECEYDDGWLEWGFCPNCGADMRGEDE